MLVTTEYFDQQVLLDATNPQTPGESSSSGVALGVLYRARMILFTNNIVPGKQTTVGQLTQPTYPGYASQQLTWQAPARDSLLGMCCNAQLVNFQMTNATVPTNVYGYGLTDPSGTILYGAELIKNGPYPLLDALSVLPIVAQYCANNPNAGQATVVQ